MSAVWSAGEVEQFLHDRIPVSKAMGIRVETCDAGVVVLTAPLELNYNHLGTAFGGSLATVATLAGYVALWTALGDREAHVVVRRSEIDYRHPVRKEIRAVCALPEGGVSDGFRRAFESKGKARMELPVVVSEGETECVVFSGDFVAIHGGSIDK